MAVSSVTSSASVQCVAYEKNESPETRGQLVEIISCFLARRFCNSDSNISNRLSLFRLGEIPNIPLRDYILRFARFSKCSKEVLILAARMLMNVNQYGSNHKDRFLRTINCNQLTIHCLFLVAAVINAKYQDEETFLADNAFYSRVGGISVERLNDLETTFLELIDFDLYLTTDKYYTFLKELADPDCHTDCDCQSFIKEFDLTEFSPPHKS